MEYALLSDTVEAIEGGADVDGSYAELMRHEGDALRVAERVSDDRRARALESASLWNTPLSAVGREYVAFWRSLYALHAAGNSRALRDRLLSPDGLVSCGITVLALLLLLSLLRT